MNRIIFLIFLFSSIVSFSQEIDSLDSDTVANASLNDSVLSSYDSLGLLIAFDYYNTKWLTFGIEHDIVNSTYGILISNGLKERPLIHFEDFSEYFVYMINVQTDFYNDYSVTANIGWQYPLRHVSLITTGYQQTDYSRILFNHQDFNISALTYWNKVNMVFIFEIGYQTLNDWSNAGVDIGIQKVISYQRLYSTLSVGYYFDYFCYNASIQGFIYKDKLGISLDYEKIDKFDFLRLRLNLTFRR